MQTYFRPNSLSSFVPWIAVFGVLTLIGCKRNIEPLKMNTSFAGEEINQLKMRIEKLEKLIEIQTTDPSIKKVRFSTSPIKSITFRIRSKDDRIRIYWADGSKTDLPCTKEQSIWACG